MRKKLVHFLSARITHCDLGSLLVVLLASRNIISLRVILSREWGKYLFHHPQKNVPLRFTLLLFGPGESAAAHRRLTLSVATVKAMSQVVILSAFPATANLIKVKLLVERTAKQHHVNLISVTTDSRSLQIKFSSDKGKIIVHKFYTIQLPK